MAMSVAERARQHRERQKRMQSAQIDKYLNVGFSEYFQKAQHARESWKTVQESLDSVGIDVQDFKEDADPYFDSTVFGQEDRKSLGYAERMLGAFTDAATELSLMIHTYKSWALDVRMSELFSIAQGDGPEARAAKEQILVLSDLKTHLSKDVRVSLKNIGTT